MGSLHFLKRKQIPNFSHPEDIRLLNDALNLAGYDAHLSDIQWALKQHAANRFCRLTPVRKTDANKLAKKLLEFLEPLEPGEFEW